MRAEILATGNPYIRSARIVIAAPASEIFAFIADPHRHHLFDGSGTVQGQARGPERLTLGARFSMGMRIGAKYRTVNTVHEYEPDQLIAWAHFSGHRWRYSLREIDVGATEVTETFDGTYARFPLALRLMGVLPKNEIAVAKTLVRLKRLVEER
jgi:uncharacterized protein YndB with AHSA1/START domain